LKAEEEERDRKKQKRLLEVERFKQEQEASKEDRFKLEQAEKKALEQEKKAKFALELIQNQILMVERQRREMEMDRELDQRNIEWQKKKAAEEAQREMEKLVEKKKKDLAVLKILETQQRAGDAKAVRDELRAKRHQEKQEREWRNLERDSMLKRAKDAEALKNTILDQIEAKQQWVIEQATFDKAVYDKILNVQDTRMEEELKAEEERKERNAQYRYDLREQIHRFQLRKIAERKEHFCEGITLRRELSRRDQELRCYMDRKLEELREHTMPEKYIKYIERAVHEELKPEWQKPISKQ